MFTYRLITTIFMVCLGTVVVSPADAQIVLDDHFDNNSVAANNVRLDYWAPDPAGNVSETNSTVSFSMTASYQLIRLNGQVLDSNLNFFDHSVTLTVKNVSFKTAHTNDPRFIMAIASTTHGVDATDLVRADVIFDPANKCFTLLSLIQKVDGTPTVLLPDAANTIAGNELTEMALTLGKEGYELTLKTKLDGQEQSPMVRRGDWGAGMTLANWGTRGDSALFLGAQNGKDAAAATLVAVDQLLVTTSPTSSPKQVEGGQESGQ